MKRFMGRIVPVLTVIFASGFQVIFLYCQNADEAGFSEALPALLAFIGVGLVLLLVFWLITRSLPKAAISASIMALVLTNFALIEKVLKLVLPNLHYWHTAPIVVVIGLHMVFLFCHFTKEQLAADISKVVCLVFGALIVINVATSVPDIIGHYRAQREIEAASEQRKITEQEKPEDETHDSQPNVYFLMFDEYANFPQLQECFNFENAELLDYLTEHNFSISYTSQNESQLSSTVQTNLVCLDYIVDDNTSDSEKSPLRKNGTLFNLMREHGYMVDIYEQGSFYGGINPVGASSSGAATASGETLDSVLGKKTIAYPFLVDDRSEHLKGIIKFADYFTIPENLPKSNTFMLLYLCFPHAPFVVDENGNSTSPADYTNFDCYLGQMRFATKLMIKILDNIINNDPNSVIVLQSDHSARGVACSGDLKRNPLNTLYWHGEKGPEIEGLSSVNTMRTILNELWDMDYEMLDVPAPLDNGHINM